MEEQQNRITPTPPESYGRRMMHVWGPIFIKWGISFVTMMIAAGICSYVYMTANLDTVMKAMESQDQNQMMNLYATLSEELLKAQTIIGGASALLTIPVMIWLFRRDKVKEKLSGVAQNKKAPLWKYGMVIVISLAMCWGLNNLIIMGNLSQMSAEYEETLKTLYSQPLFIQLICLGVLIPICEELVFRGLVFKRLRAQGNFMQAALYSAVVFGLLHVNMVQMLYGFILGMLLAYLYEKLGSVKAPILAHVSMNIFSVLATEYQLFDWLVADRIRIGVATVLCAAAASTMYVLIQRIEEQPEIAEVTEVNP